MLVVIADHTTQVVHYQTSSQAPLQSIVLLRANRASFYFRAGIAHCAPVP